MRRDVLLYAQSARVRGVEREVLTPRVRPRHLFVMGMDEYDQHLYADAGGHAGLAELVAVAATEPRRMVYIPKGPEWPDELPPSAVDPRRGLGMLFMHHSAQFRPSDWPELRRRLGPRRPVRRQVEIRERARSPESDPVDLRVHAETVVVTGSAPPLRQVAATLWGEVRYGRHAHVHLRDMVSLRRDRGFRTPDIPDVITAGWTRWCEEGPFAPYAYRWVYRDRRAEEDAKGEMARDGWQFVRWIDGAMVFRREEG